MSRTRSIAIRRGAVAAVRRQQGFVLIVGLILLVVVSLLSVSMFRSFGLQERIAGNTRDKQRSFEAAQTAVQFGEWWLTNLSGATTGSTCTNPVSGNTLSNMRVCSSELADPWDPATWTSTTAPRIDYQPTGMAVLAGGGFSTTANDINYQTVPSLHIQYMGSSSDGKALLYRVSGFAQGGNLGTVSVIQSTFQLQTETTVVDSNP